jgi:MFS family permease
MRTGFRAVLRRRDVLAVLVPYVLARLPLTMASLALLLMTQQQTGSYHRAGLACGAYAFAVAIAAPVLGRLVDRQGQRRVLLVSGVVHACAMVVAATLAQAGRYWLMILAVAVAGISLPPVTACMRVLWTHLLPDGPSRQAGFALDGMIVEVAELGGPLLVSLLLVTGRPATAVGASGVLMGIAAVVFRLTSPPRAVIPKAADRSAWGALAIPGVRRLLVVIAASTATIGGVEVAVTAFARHHGGLSSAGLYIGVISAGGIVAGLAFGGSARTGGRHPAGLLATYLSLSAIAVVCIGGERAPVFVAGTLFVFGGAVAVGVILQLATMSAIVNEDVRTEAFTWGATANFVGLGCGTSVAGWMLDGHGLDVALFVAAVPTVLAVVMTLVSWSTFSVLPSELEDAAEGVIAVDASPDVAALIEEIDDLRARMTDLESALAAAMDPQASLVEDARGRARRMLDRADAACLEMRERAQDDAERVRAAATTASLEIMAAGERDARAMLGRARREADAVLSRAQRAADSAETPRPALHALPALIDGLDGQEAAASS